MTDVGPTTGTGGCDSCGGGDRNIHTTNTDPTVDSVTTVGNVVAHPKPGRPWDWCIQQIGNVDVTDLVDASTGDYQLMVWDPESCQMRVAEFPCDEWQPWDNTAAAAPTTCGECVAGRTIYYRETNTDCLTHICVNGQLLEVCGGVNGDCIDKVCYDVAGWFPASFGGGSGFWSIYGLNEMDAPCADGPQSFHPPATSEFACWDDFGGSTGPVDGWNSLTWEDDIVNPGTETIGATDTSHGCARPAFRVDPNFPIGSSGPLTWELFFSDPSGQTTFAAYDTVSGQQLPVTVLVEPGNSAAQLQIVNGPNGSQVQTLGAIPGQYLFEFSLPSGVAAENVEFLAWNMGATGSTERFSTVDSTAIVSTATCCNEWQSINQLAAWMTQNDPLGAVWFVDGTSVCTVVTSGVGQNYGALASCDDQTNPTVEAICDGEAAESLHFAYVDYDPGLHANGEVAGSGTSGDPYQIPVCCGGGTTADRSDADYCGFDIGGTISPRVVYCDGPMTVTVVTTAPPVGGDETFGVEVNGSQVGTVTLQDGQSSATAGPFTVAAGDVVQATMLSTTAVQPSAQGAVSYYVDCSGAGAPPAPDPDPDPDPGPDPECSITQQLTGATGEVGDSISLGGASSTGVMNWQTSATADGTWSSTTEPTSITSEGSSWYRFCCASGICSDPVEVVGTAPPGEFRTENGEILGPDGSVVMGGGMNATSNQPVSGG